MIIEQLYPSMQRSIKNMTDRAEQYENLGIDAIWISPFYPSSGFDNGYDVKDFKDVDSKYGTLADFVDLVNVYHSKGMKVFIDLVINHCSIEHPIYRKALRGDESEQAMFHMYDKPQNDWEAIFGGSVWKYEPSIDKYVFHAFTEGQIDWNFDNEEVWKYWEDVIAFWLIDMNVDGFRIDALTHMAKGDWNTPKVEGDAGAPYRCAPKLEGYLEKLANLIYSIKSNAFIIGEANGCNIETAKKWINNHWMNCVIQFEHRGAFELEKTERKGDTLDCILAMKNWSERMMNYYNHLIPFDRSSGEMRTVYYFLNKADGYFLCVDVFWEREIYLVYAHREKPSYGKCVNMEPLASFNRDLLLSMPYDNRDMFNLDPFEPILNYLNLIGFEKLDQNELSKGVLHNRLWKSKVKRF